MSTHQLLVIWEHGRRAEAAVVEMIERDPALEIVGTVEVSWPEPMFGLALGRLYGERLPSRSEKQRHCGTGPFLVVIVRDLDPRPGLRRTPRGIETVDTHLFDVKQRARLLTGGGHRVHATDNADEFRRDLRVLTGMTDADLPASGGFGHRRLSAAPDGVERWSSVDAMLAALEQRMPACVLRNFESWDELGPVDEHPDIDLLVASPDEAANTLAARPTSRRRGRVQHEVRIGDRVVNIDLRSPDDRYLPEALARRTLERARPGDRGFRIPAPDDHFATLLYHAVVHRPTMTDDYADRLRTLAASIGVAVGDLHDPATQRAVLAAMAEPVLPTDPSVRFNDRLLGVPPGLRRRRAEQWARSTAGRGLRSLGLAS